MRIAECRLMPDTGCTLTSTIHAAQFEIRNSKSVDRLWACRQTEILATWAAWSRTGSERQRRVAAIYGGGCHDQLESS
jgi:hypothetical protein